MGWFSCFQPRKPTPPAIACSANSHPLDASKPKNNLKYPASRTDEGLEKWKAAKDRRVAEEQRTRELEISAYHQGRNQRRQVSGVELSPGHYDSSSQRQQRESASKSNGRPNSGVEHYPPYYDERRRQKTMSGVDHYPVFEEIMEHERQAPRSIFERFDHSTDAPKRRPSSGVEHYAPMEVVDEHERPNPLALDSIYVMAFEQPGGQASSKAGRSLNHEHKPLEGQADSKAGRSLTHKRKPDTGRGRQADPWGSDGGLAKPENSGSPTRQKGPIHKSSQQASGRERSDRRG